MQRICRAAKERPCYLELNSQPERLDLDDAQFDYLDYGVVQARRGWLGAQDVLNTRPLAEVRGLLHATRL